MAFKDRDLPPHIAAGIRQILGLAGVTKCAFWVEDLSQRFHRTIYLDPSIDLNDCERKGTQAYCVGPMTEIFTGYAAVQLTEEKFGSLNPLNSSEPCQQQVGLKLPLLTIDRLVSHSTGLQSCDDLHFAPDGKFLPTEDDFLENVQREATKDSESEESKKMTFRWVSSTSNYILLGMILLKYTCVPMGELLKKLVFEPFGMEYTYATSEAFNNLPPAAKAEPHIVTNRGAQKIEYPRYFETSALAAIGVYSCTKDFAAFFQGILKALNGESKSVEYKVARHFLFKFVELKNGWFGPAGYHTKLRTGVPGIFSPNKLSNSPNSDGSECWPVTDQKGQPLEVISSGSSLTGFECRYYFMPETQSFVIVFSNATGLVDVADIISRYLIQELFDFKYQAFNFCTKKSEVDFIEETRVRAAKRREYIEIHFPSNLSPVSSQHMPQLIGKYENKPRYQYILISSQEGGGDGLVAKIAGRAGCSGPFIVVLIDATTVDLRPIPSWNLPFLSVDIIGDWKPTALVIETDISGNVISLTRKKEKADIQYIRTD